MFCDFHHFRSVKEFDWEVDEGERIWIQVIQMDLTVNVSDILHTGECSTNPSRVEIYESKSEPLHGKTNYLHRRKQRLRSASQ